MPHLTVEYSANLDDGGGMDALCHKLARCLDAVRDGDQRVYPLGGIRVRALRCDVLKVPKPTNVIESPFLRALVTPSMSESTAALAAAVDDAPVVKLINGILTDAVLRGASDIHIEPFENRLKVRYRIDGVLEEAESPPANLTAAVISRIKIMAKLNIAERRLPQDGRIDYKVGNRDLDMRVSTLPGVLGESIVLRILDRGDLSIELSALGMPESAGLGFTGLHP